MEFESKKYDENNENSLINNNNISTADNLIDLSEGNDLGKFKN
jgi:hypothetical protein